MNDSHSYYHTGGGEVSNPRTRYHFVREFVDSGYIKIEFVRSVENNSDLFTKNVNQELYEKHKTNFLVDSEEFGTS
jgi:hypothetical protein